ncbi:MAG: arginase family protein [Cyanobacteria bacterium J06623_5]
MDNGRLNLFFPQWQGAGNLELLLGAQKLRQILFANKAPQQAFVEVSVSSIYQLQVENNILGHAQIVAQLADANRRLRTINPHRIFTIGGDCGVEIAPVSFLNQRYNNNLAIVWLDAHSDLNTPLSSPSRRFHGMSLRMLTENNDATIERYQFSRVDAKQIFLVGSRELGSPEEHFIKQKSLPLFTASEINAGNYLPLISAIKAAKYNNLYIHLDLDVIEPTIFPHVTCPTPNGITLSGLYQLLSALADEFTVVGASVLELLPRQGIEPPVESAIAAIRPHVSQLLR